MAAILEKLLAKEISPEQLTSWLKSSKHQDNTLALVSNMENNKYEFLPYFLNYLRDQSSHLLQASRSTVATPAKTPTTAKLQRLTSFSGSQKNESSVQPARRQQLFASETKDRTFQDKHSYPLSSSLSKTGCSQRKQFRNKTKDSSGKSQRGIQFTEAAHKSKHKTSLGDFFRSPDIDSKLQVSPVQLKWDDSSPSGQFSRKSASKCRVNEKKQKSLQKSNISCLMFDDNEFPPMNSEDRSVSVPEGAILITPSRRITPTHVDMSSETRDSLLFKNAPISAAGSCKARGVWGKVDARDFSQKGKLNSDQMKEKPPRRIAPTLISSDVEVHSNDSIVNTVSLFPNRGWRSTHCNDDQENNVLAKQESYALVSQNSSTVSPDENQTPMTSLSSVTPVKSTLEQQVSVETVIADKNKVTYQESLDVMIKVYSFCINAFLVPNLAVELYFLAQLLTVHEPDTSERRDINKDPVEIQYFISVHNAVYFAVMVLANITRILCHLDCGTLRLFIDNQRILDFQPELKEELSELYKQVPSKTVSKSLPSPIGGVSFQADTDNRKNFPNERSFHLFKKQRDGFYELIREWEENHLTAGWSMSEVQMERVQNLISYQTELANHIHFVRLFQSQLIQMCKDDSSWQKDEEDENIALLSELKLTNPKKLKRLKERLIRPALHGGPCPAPSFPGCQEFFKDFISSACNPFFNQLLSDQLLHKILEMNDVQFISLDVTYEEDEEIMLDSGDRETLLNCILTSKLLAKFLGFVSFLPYNTPEVLPEGLQASFISIRNRSSQPVDVSYYVANARKNGRTVLTVPWVAEFLSMIDPLANHLIYFQELFSLLLTIYREASEAFERKQTSSYLLVLTVLGWLFELPCFPEGQLFTELNPVTSTEVSKLALDNLNIVDQHILYSCCPYLGEVRRILVDFAVGLSGRSSSVRKITPITADTLIDICPTTITDKQLQHQLEENFFHNQPASLKKTVEFVADRVSSNHIKLYRTSYLPEVFAEAQKHIPHIAEEIVKLRTDSSVLGQKEVQQSVEKLATELASKAKALCMESAPRYCCERCQDALSLLLPEELPQQVWKIAALISYRQALDKVNSWLNMQITAHMFKKELLVTSDLERQVRSLTKKNVDEMSSSLQPLYNISGQETDLIHSSSTQTKTSSTPVTSDIQCKSFMFESPVRALQNLPLRTKLADQQNPINYLMQQDLTSQETSGTPTSKCIRNLSSFDKEPLTGSPINTAILVAQLSEVSVERHPKHDQSSINLTKSLTDSAQSACKSCGDMESLKMMGVQLEHFRSFPDNRMGTMNRTSVQQMLNAKECAIISDSSRNAPSVALSMESMIHQCTSFKDVTHAKATLISNCSKTCSSNDSTRGTDTQCGSSDQVLSDFESLSKTSDSSSTSSILSKTGSSRKKLSISFSDGSTVCTHPDGLTFTHSTPRISPDKLQHGANSLTDVEMNSGGFSSLLDKPSPTELLVALKECVRCLIQAAGSQTSSHIISLLNSVIPAFDGTDNQVVLLMSKMMTKLSIDLAFTIALQHRELMTSELQDLLFMFWKVPAIKKVLNFSSILCAEHVQHLEPENHTYMSLVKYVLDSCYLDMSCLASNANQLLSNEYLKCDIIVIVSQFMCDLLPSLPEHLLQCGTLHELVTKLADEEEDASRRQTLISLLKKTSCTCTKVIGTDETREMSSSAKSP